MSNKAINNHNQYIMDEFIKYYTMIYNSFSTSDKSSKENYYKLSAIKKVIDTIKKFKPNINAGSDLAHIKGIGTKTISRIDEIINFGYLSEIKENIIQTLAIKELSSIYGIGPQKASEFYEKYNIKNISDLILADKKSIIKLSYQMKSGLKYHDVYCDHIPREFITKLKKYFNKILLKIDKNFIFEICGSYRRGSAFSRDVDILITHKYMSSTEVTNKLNLVVKTFTPNLIIDSLNLNPNTHFQGWAIPNNIPGAPKIEKFNANKKLCVFRIDITIIEFRYYYSALLHFTGSSTFNQKIRSHAKSLGYKLSEYGLEPLTHGKLSPTINSEKDIFDILLLKYIPPEKR